MYTHVAKELRNPARSPLDILRARKDRRAEPQPRAFSVGAHAVTITVELALRLAEERVSPTFRAPAIRMRSASSRLDEVGRSTRVAMPPPKSLTLRKCANERRPMPLDKLAAVMTPEAVEAARTSGALRETDDTGFYPSAAM